MPDLTTTDGVSVLTLGDDENRFAPTWLDEVEAALDDVVAAGTPLVTVGAGKFYSNGLDLEWAQAHPDDFVPYVARVEALLARVLALPVPTVAAVNGHAFGGGGLLALAHDWRLMRADRGFFCLPEVDIALPFTPGMAALVQAKPTPRAAVDTMTTGARLGGTDAARAGIVDGTAPEESLLADAIAKVAPLAGKDRTALGAIKETMFGPAVGLLRGSAG
ncbi:enoyl-CoA hydratase/isomerase family protein [Nocardioides sp. W3-2-3]|uniref:enoyl-CoA hydratase-related protein n=1 Tax=Nocardioides convexus TaxID=2712224 RepID=UPI0024184B71|nr:enoyl-CoA hydratase-related protein [Nocardioides convexus]NHA01580.1 enoyl-CoA hydratase/isomerase family protein [Nocardioides convexus]